MAIKQPEFSTTYEETISLIVYVGDAGVLHALISYLIKKVDSNYEGGDVVHDYYDIYQHEFDKITEDIDDAPAVLVSIIEYIRDDDLYEQLTSIAFYKDM